MNENIYNFNEISFIISIVATVKVITQTDKCLCLSFIQFENQKWVIIIEIINASGWVLLSIVIFTGKTHCIV